MRPATTSALPPRPRASLGRILDDLGVTLLELAHGDLERVGRSEEIGGVVIHDRCDAPLLPPNALVLGVGLDEPDDVVALLRQLGDGGAAGLVLRAPVQLTDAVVTASDRAGVALLALTRGAQWAHLAGMLRSLLSEGDEGGSVQESLGGLPSGDLFAVANAVASLLDAPVTIEDRGSRVLAFSGRQEEADASRVETILGRQVPARYARFLNERGVFRDLYRSDRPVFIGPVPGDDEDFTVPRVAVAVRAGDEVLGSIWAAVPGPLSPERTEALRDAAKLVALHLLRVRAGADVQRRVRTDLVGSILEGGPSARAALERLGLADTPLLVLGFTLAEPDADGELVHDASVRRTRERLGDAFAMHLTAVSPRSASALLGGVVYGLVAVRGSAEDGAAQGARLAHDFLGRIGDRLRPIVAIGPMATTLSEIVEARTTTDRILRALREHKRTTRVARLEDVQTESLLLELRDLVLARGEELTGPLARLAAYDTEHEASLVATLRAWLDAFGDVNRAAAATHVHPNTFRYRLRRVREVGDLDLDQPEQRFAVMMQLSVWTELKA